MKRTIGRLFVLLALGVGSVLAAQKAQTRKEFDRQALEALELQVEVDRDLEAVAKELEEAEAELGRAAEGVQGLELRARLELQARVRFLRTSVLLDLGRVEEARHVFQLLESSGVQGKEAADLPRLRERLARAEGAAPGAERIEKLVSGYLAIGNLAAIQELGALAAPPLERWIEEHLDTFPPSVEDDPLLVLDKISREASSRLVEKHLAGSSYLFKRRLLRVMGYSRIFLDKSAYLRSEAVPRPTRYPAWMRVVEAAADEPSLFGYAREFIRWILSEGACTPELARALIAAVEPTDPRFDEAVVLLNGVGSFGEDARPILEHALRSPDAELRNIASEKWRRYFRDRGPLHALAGDPEVGVRRNVALALSRDQSEEDLEVLTRLAGDPAGSVRQAVAKALEEANWKESGPLLLPVLQALYRSEGMPLSQWSHEQPTQELLKAVQKALANPSCLVPFVRFALEADDAWLLGNTVQEREQLLRDLPLDMLPAYVDALFRAAPASLARFLEELDDRRAAEWVRPELIDGLHTLARRTGQDSALTLLLGLCYPRSTPADLLPVLHAAFADPRWNDALLTSKELEWLNPMIRNGVQGLPDAQRNELFTALARDPAVLDWFLFRMTQHLDLHAPGGIDAARAIVDRWLEEDYSYPVEGALIALGPLEDSKPLLRRLAGEERYVRGVIRAMAASHDPAYVPDLARLARAALERNDDGMLDHATTALMTFLTDEAAEALLDLAPLVEAGPRRAALLAGVENVRQYQDARARWERRKLERATARETTQELLDLLGAKSEPQRVAALHGLAALGALETLPRIIRLLDDPSEAIRAAAQAAIERLTTLEELERDE